MSEPRELERFLPVALAWLRDLTARRVEPRNALRELEHLRPRAPALGLELVWEATGPESEVHYDLLLTHGRETVSLSHGQEEAVPWPLRGVQRWSDKHVVRVDGELLDVETLMARLDFQWSDSRVLTRLVDECLIRQEIRKRDLHLSDRELQQALDVFRIRRGLLRAEDTQRWLEARGLSHERLERHVEAQQLTESLKQRIAGGREEAWFQTHREELDELSTVTVRHEEAPWLRSLKTAVLEAGPAGSLLPVQRAVQADGLHPTQLTFGRMRREGVRPEVRSALFGASPESVVGPLAGERGFELLIVLARHPARFDEATRTACRDALFEAWLEERRRQARIEWFWGPESYTREPS